MTVRRLLAALLIAAAGAGAAGSAPAAGGRGGLFSSYQTVTVELKAPFDELFANARDDKEYSVQGFLAYTAEGGDRGAIRDVKVALRGHTSRGESECAFPKLKLSFDDSDDAPLFAGRTSVKVGTHCDDKDALTPKYGRLPNERSPWREAFVYRLLDILNVPALKARPARITYVFTDSGDDGSNGRRLTRNALLLEDDDDAKQRFSATGAITEEEFTNADAAFAPADTARLVFAEALIGNFDWCLRMTPRDTYRCDGRHPLWNILAFTRDGRTTPVIYDFDVSGMVAGRHHWFDDVYNEAFVASKSRPAVEVLGQLQRTRSLFQRDVLDATRASFLERKDAVYAALHDAPLDEDGRSTIKEYADSFFDAIASDEAFYRPVVVARDAMAWRDEERKERACGTRSGIPPGTPVTEPLESRGSMARVILLDVFWRWAAPDVCTAVHRDAVWIDRAAIGRNYPR